VGGQPPRHSLRTALLSTGVSTPPTESDEAVAAPSPRAVTIRLAIPDDAAAIMAIYNVEVQNHTSTFDLVPRTLDEQRQWLGQRSGAFSAVVALLDGEVVGFAALSPYKERPAYRTTVEDSVYVSRDHPRLGIGRTLMDHVIGIAADSGFHSVMARIEASSTASRALHAACGFELVGIEREVGRKFNRWLDVAVMQLML
jgi:L-amino acid N-acyltransferase YncA